MLTMFYADSQVIFHFVNLLSPIDCHGIAQGPVLQYVAQHVLCAITNLTVRGRRA